MGNGYSLFSYKYRHETSIIMPLQQQIVVQHLRGRQDSVSVYSFFVLLIQQNILSLFIHIHSYLVFCLVTHPLYSIPCNTFCSLISSITVILCLSLLLFISPCNPSLIRQFNLNMYPIDFPCLIHFNNFIFLYLFNSIFFNNFILNHLNSLIKE